MKNKEYILIVEATGRGPRQVCVSRRPAKQVYSTLIEIKEFKKLMEESHSDAVYNIYEITKVER